MCDVTTALLVVNTSAALYGHMRQSAMADTQQDNIAEGYALQMQQLQDRYQQINQNAADQTSERAREARQELARIRVAGAESGLGGVSQVRNEGESQMLASQDMATIEGNRQNYIKAGVSAGENARVETRARQSAVHTPSLIGTGLQIAGAGIKYADRTNDTPSVEDVRKAKGR